MATLSVESPPTKVAMDRRTNVFLPGGCFRDLIKSEAETKKATSDANAEK